MGNESASDNTEVCKHRPSTKKWSSEISTRKTVKGFHNDITQTECQDKHCLNIFCHLVCAILLFTPLRSCERFEDRLPVPLNPLTLPLN